ncbi:MAG TPA: SDR family NAD(P)-dependent oxidoreductase, partial [Thermoanaerobaculia bacterium]|nr:SDR family NAD(P)-dependent oxidoreductase [Thermoanaerobaculia bacterium]
SLALDTMCSSSLTAIHLACEELRKGEIEAAIAGGVNLTIHPYKYLSLSQGKFAASDGKCRSFGAGGDGYVPGEGVGAVLLKPLDAALRDGDQVYAVIKSSAVNHGGKTNGYTVPNPNAQADLILDALRKADIDPKTLSYVETHGTGTSLGDPIEITALSRAFAGSEEEKQFCPIGSVKSNIGHLESAAGIAAVTKALLQLRNKQLVPSLHADPLNPNIDFADSPFYVQTELAEWERTGVLPRRVGVSSFGAGGSNAHLILEEHADVREEDSAPHSVPFLLSAKNPDALRRYAGRVARFLGDTSNVSLADIAYTSQVGRTPMDARLVVITTSIDDLRAKLSAWGALRTSEEELEDVFYGNLREAQYGAGNLIDGAAGKVFLESLLTNRELEKIARLWVLGVNVDWSQMYGHAHPRKVTMPTYPFAKERYWVDRESPSRRTIQTTPAVQVPEEKRRTYYSAEWTLKALAAIEDARPVVPILLLDVTDELAHTLRQQPGAARVILVKPGKTFQEIEPDLYVLDPTQEEHFHELVQTIEERVQLPALVLHHFARPCDLADRQQVDEQLERGVYALLHLSRALMKRKHPAPMKILSLFSSDGAAASPLGTAVSGFLETLALENPRFEVKVVDIQSEGLAGLILDEVRDPHWTAQEIRYRIAPGGQHQRYVSAFVPRTYAESALSALPLRQRGVYLITGGLGQLGLIFAEYLAKNFQAKLILVGRSASGATQEKRLRRLESYGAEVLTVQADVGRLEDVERVIRDAKARFGTINGVIHAAGVNRDAFILRKTREEMAAVLEPKVYGAINLDLATRDESLDLFVLFSSVAGATGNAGQSDYAYANHFLDAFAESRARRGSGRTLSINWPLWEDGGMGLSSGDVALLEKQTGTSPMPAQEGIRCWEDLLRSQATQGIALYGVPSKIAAFMAAKNDTTDRLATPMAEAVDPVSRIAEVEAYLKALIGEEIKLEPERIGSSDRLESFGIDSVMINRINVILESDFGALPKTLLYEHETIRELATFLVHEMRAAVTARFGSASPAVAPPASASSEMLQEVSIAGKRDDAEPIAIIGIHGSYPHSANLNEYWDNLKNGRDLIDLVPVERWDSEALYDADPAAAADGKIYCKWGAFLEDYDKFDPQFFRIPAEEANVIDPQERLFLQSVWAAVEDAGYTRESLKKRFPKHRSADVGVFVGVTTNSYQLVASGEGSRGDVVRPSSLPWSIANRVSYFFDFAGPSMPIDTACSSSLVAIHLACESLRSGDCQVAIAGGVNLYLHPAKYHALCQKRMLSSAGKCHSYGAGDDGFVPGEGVGTVVLKPLSKAIADRDRIYAVIPGSAYEHSGRSNGYSAPNPNAQASVIGRALAKASVGPESISYVEGHGTGTQLGDSLEVAALTQAFRGGTARQHFCALGSVKANIGHSESAAGIAGLAKVLLQLEHRQLAPSIHSDVVNPNIEFEESPFYLQHGLSDWESSAGQPRRALINSFGAGGVNACLVVEEYEDVTPSPDAPITGPCIFALSAKNEERLRESASRLLRHLRSEQDIDLARLCYTLQTGREAMQERLAFVVSDVADLVRRLDEWGSRGASADVYRGSVDSRRGAKRSPAVIGEQSLSDLASMWTAGEEVEWERLYASTPPRRIALPTYPFARERYWVDVVSAEEPVLPGAQLHPLISFNSSTLQEVSFSTSLSDTLFYAVDHQVNGSRIFPGAGFLEMACIAGNLVGQQRVRKIQDIVWSQPLRFGSGPQTLRTVLQLAGDRVEYAISSLDDENETVLHSEGRLFFEDLGVDAADTDADTRVSIEELKTQCAVPERGAVYYEKFREHGLQYGRSFQTIQEIHVADLFALSRLKLAEHLHGGFEQFILHPSIVDGALQTVAGLVGSLSSTAPYVPFALDEIDIARPLPPACYALAEFAGSREQNYAGVRKFTIRLLNEGGEVLVTFKNLFVRALANAEARVPGVVSAAR